MKISEADLDAAIALLREVGMITFEYTGRNDKSYVARDGRFFLAYGEDGGLQDEREITERELRDAIVKRPQILSAFRR